MRKVLTALFGILLAAGPAAAQDYPPVGFNFGFGWVFPSGDFGNSFDAGWTGTVGATFNLSEHMGIQADYTYNRMDGQSRTILVSQTPGLAAATNGIIESNHQLHVGTFDLVYRSKSSNHPLGGYVLAGPGVYHRVVQLTSPAVGYTTICDPWWYVCYPALVPVDQIVGDRTSWDFGINLGGGVTFRQGSHQFDIIRLLGGGLVKSVRASTFDWDPNRRSIGLSETPYCSNRCVQ